MTEQIYSATDRYVKIEGFHFTLTEILAFFTTFENICEKNIETYFLIFF